MSKKRSFKVKQVVVEEQLDELEVHPPGVYQRLVEICVDSAQQLLTKQDELMETDCPACTSEQRNFAFEKHGYTYWCCQSCATLFVSPRPTEQMVDWYLLHSPAATFRRSSDYLDALHQRFTELAFYRAEWVSLLCDRFASQNQEPVVDVETRSPEYLAELERRQVGPLIAVKPLCPPSDLQSGGLKISEELRDLGGVKARLVSCFDNLERHSDPSALIHGAFEALGPGGLLVFTTRSGSGFDIQVLWEHATIFPIEHLNLLSLEGVRALLDKAGFQILEASTPGQLDVQMIERVLQEQKLIEVPRFVSYFLRHRDKLAKRKLQYFLQEHLLSSHLRVVAYKEI